MSAFIVPPALRAGDLLAVVAPSSPVPEADLWRGLAWLRGRYRIRASARILARQGYLAGDDAARSSELSSALADPEVKAVVAVRGGYGAMRILDSVDLRMLDRFPKWIVGFSDITALHAAAWAQSIASIHGPHVGSLGGASASVRASWLAALERPNVPREWRGLTVVHPGEATGPIVGGNLTLLFSMAASGRLTVPDGALLAIEDITERPYRVDRMLTALGLGGYLQKLAGSLVGSFHHCDPGPDGVEVHDIIAERTRSLGIPVLSGAPFGHGDHNESFVLGLPARISASKVSLATVGRAPEIRDGSSC
jgi:muramoyltetrapeptide carboxypeptidase